MAKDELRLAYIHEPEVNYAVRVCMTLAQAKVQTPTSVVKECMECDAPVWYDEAMVAPTEYNGTPIDGEVWMCIACVGRHALYGDKPPEFMSMGLT